MKQYVNAHVKQQQNGENPAICIRVEIDGEFYSFNVPFALYSNIRFGTKLPLKGGGYAVNRYHIDTDDLTSSAAQTALGYWEALMLDIMAIAVDEFGTIQPLPLNALWDHALENLWAKYRLMTADKYAYLSPDKLDRASEKVDQRFPSNSIDTPNS